LFRAFGAFRPSAALAAGQHLGGSEVAVDAELERLAIRAGEEERGRVERGELG